MEKKLIKEINTFRKFTNQDLLSEQEFSNKLFGGPSPNWDLGSPAGHKKRHPGGSWADNNAYDIRPSNNIVSGAGTPVYSLTSGKVSSATNRNGFVQKIKNGGKYNLFGSNLTVSSSDGPDVFYTHLENLQVKTGDEIKKGQLIGYIGDAQRRFSDHVHIAVKSGDVKDLVNPVTGEIEGSSYIDNGSSSSSDVISGIVKPNSDKISKILDMFGLGFIANLDLDNDGKNFAQEVSNLFGGDSVEKDDSGEISIAGYKLKDLINLAKEYITEDIKKIKKKLL